MQLRQSLRLDGLTENGSSRVGHAFAHKVCLCEFCFPSWSQCCSEESSLCQSWRSRRGRNVCSKGCCGPLSAMSRSPVGRRRSDACEKPPTANVFYPTAKRAPFGGGRRPDNGPRADCSPNACRTHKLHPEHRKCQRDGSCSVKPSMQNLSRHNSHHCSAANASIAARIEHHDCRLFPGLRRPARLATFSAVPMEYQIAANWPARRTTRQALPRPHVVR
jgi:hypothetical protein